MFWNCNKLTPLILGFFTPVPRLQYWQLYKNVLNCRPYSLPFFARNTQVWHCMPRLAALSTFVLSSAIKLWAAALSNSGQFTPTNPRALYLLAFQPLAGSFSALALPSIYNRIMELHFKSKGLKHNEISIFAGVLCQFSSISNFFLSLISYLLS
jgi:hypothetical protein